MKYIFSFSLIFCAIVAQAQQRSLDHSDYDSWNRIGDYEMTLDGKYIAVQTDAQQGDSHVELIRTSNGKSNRFERASNPAFTSDGMWLFFQVSAPYEEIRQLKLKETKKEDMPKDVLVKVNVRNGRVDTVGEVGDFRVHRYHGAFVAVQFEEEPEVDTASVEESSDFVLDGEEEKHGSGYYDEDAKSWYIWNVTTGVRDTLERVSSFSWARNVPNAAFVQSAGDSTQPARVMRWFALNGQFVEVDTAFEKASRLTLDVNGRYLAYLTTHDSDDADIRYFDLKLSDGTTFSRTVLESKDAEIPEGWMISEFNPVNFSENASALYLGTRPVPVIYEEDTTILKSERVSLDIWSWTDEEIQPMQKVNSKSDEERSYEGRIRMSDMAFVQLEDEELEHVAINPKIELDIAVGYMTPHKERASLSWHYPTPNDFYIINLNTGEKSLVARAVRSFPRLSPAGKYVYWWDGVSKEWKGYRVSDGQALVLSANIDTPVYNEEHDTPDEPDSYGSAGWTEGDAEFVLYDAFDIWSVTPGGAAKNLTNGAGRRDHIRYRYEKIENDEVYLPSNQWMLYAFNEDDKSTAYVEFDLEKNRLESLVKGDFQLLSLSKADSAEVYTYRRSTFVDYPEIYVVRGDDLDDAKVVTHTNPQQSEFRWGTSELVHWTTPKGRDMEGLLYKPSDFDPNKQYPVLVYFYETYSDDLHRYYAPAPSASVINFPYFLSNEYIIFIPDVAYEEGHPGASAEECIISGAEMIAQYPWADASRMAIQGQSWGGYQVAHLVTRTNMFKCAMAGAPVSNMTSAYGGIRWGSGMSREFQYERTQSRIGGTLWERRDLYLENSPVFYADQVQTPLLIMHNDGDGAVPWYQGIEYFMALRRLNRPVWMLVYNGEEHNLMQRHNRKDLSIRMAQFFDYYLKDAPIPEWMAQGRRYNEKEHNPATQLQD